jgi:CheY-like chemotaxis protein
VLCVADEGGFSRAAAEHPDVVLVDWHLGALGATRAVADLKRRRVGAAWDLPVALTATTLPPSARAVAGRTGAEQRGGRLQTQPEVEDEASRMTAVRPCLCLRFGGAQLKGVAAGVGEPGEEGSTR